MFDVMCIVLVFMAAFVAVPIIMALPLLLGYVFCRLCEVIIRRE